MREYTDEDVEEITKNALRDHFAGQVLAGLMAAPDLNDAYLSKKGDGDRILGTARECYDYADAMLAARAEVPHG